MLKSPAPSSALVRPRDGGQGWLEGRGSHAAGAWGDRKRTALFLRGGEGLPWGAPTTAEWRKGGGQARGNISFPLRNCGHDPSLG